MKKNKPLAENIQFLLVGILLILGGLQQNNFPLIGNLLLGTGILLLVYVSYSLISKKTNKLLKLFALLGELMGLLAAAYILYQSGSNYLHFLYLLASLGIVIAIVVHFLKMRDKRKFTQ